MAIKIRSNAEMPPTRSALAAFGEILALSVVMLMLATAVVVFSYGNNASAVIEAMPLLGEKTLEHIGWALGCYIAILLAFYLVVIGGQLIDVPHIPETRRTLAFLGEVMAASLAPAMVLIIAYCITAPEEVGALLVVLPVTIITVVVATQLGGFLALTKQDLLGLAESRKQAAEASIEKILRVSKSPAWLVMSVTIVAIPALVSLVAAIVERSMPAALFVLVVSAMVVVPVAIVGLELQHAANVPNDRVTIYSGRFLFGVAAALAGLVVFAAASNTPSAAIYIAFALALTSASVLLPRRSSPQWLLNITVRGAALRRSRWSLTRMRDKEVTKIRELRKEIESAPPRARDRLKEIAMMFQDVWNKLV